MRECWQRILRNRAEKSRLLGVNDDAVDRLELKQGDKEDCNLF